MLGMLLAAILMQEPIRHLTQESPSMNTQHTASSSETASDPKTANAAATPTTHRASEKAHDTVDKLADSAATAEERIRGAVASGEEQLREKQKVAKESAEKAIEQVRQYTRDNPLMAAGIAFAAGLFFARIVGR
jgi:ElaB/YqjD/DUF883 family membrane-anchored ribosome-binding protein